MFGKQLLTTFWALAMLALVSLPATSQAATNSCPFCSAVAQTLGEEIGTNDVVVFAKMLKTGPDNTNRLGGGGDVTKAEFEIVQVIKGDDFHTVGTTLETVVFGDAAKDEVFMIMGIDPPRTVWSTPLKVSEREREYITKIPGLPLEGVDRMAFFLQFLEDRSSMLAADAYDEFARAPYKDVIALKDIMNHDLLVEWIQDADISASRKRLYLTMLGICGDEKDLPMLEELIKSPERRRRSGLDAMIACYLTLKGPDGLKLIDKLFLENQDAEYADTYAAITALRFHGSEEDVIPKAQILKSLELMLKRPRLADLVIPDLARWNHWEVMDKLVQLFKDADESTNWVRVPVVNFLRACPLPEAKERLKELEKIDPEAIRRANTFFPLPDDDDEEVDDAADDTDGSNANLIPAGRTQFVEAQRPEGLSRFRNRNDEPVEYVTTVTPRVGDQVPERSSDSDSSTQVASTATPSPAAAAPGSSLFTLLLSSTFACVVMFFLLWGLLTGRIVSLIS